MLPDREEEREETFRMLLLGQECKLLVRNSLIRCGVCLYGPLRDLGCLALAYAGHGSVCNSICAYVSVSHHIANERSVISLFLYRLSQNDTLQNNKFNLPPTSARLP